MWLIVGGMLLGGALLIALTVFIGNVAAHKQTTQQAKITTRALEAMAATFDANYHLNHDGAVWDRWDPSSQAIISRADFITRHAHCNTAPSTAVVTSVTLASHGFFAVHSEMDGVKLTDFWHYVSGQWRFSLRKSNPSAVRLYQEPAAAYYRNLGCAA